MFCVISDTRKEWRFVLRSREWLIIRDLGQFVLEPISVHVRNLKNASDSVELFPSFFVVTSSSTKPSGGKTNESTKEKKQKRVCRLPGQV